MYVKMFGLMALLCLVGLAGDSAPRPEKKGLKVFISADIEGVAGVVNSAQTSSAGEEYQKVREWMTDEVLAAIEGARAAGATEFIVADSHGSMLNLIPDKFGTDTKLIRGWARPLGMMQGIDSTFDAVFFIGYHAQAGTENAIIAHTITGGIYNLKINGVTVPEAGLNALIAGHFGVPVALISGDKAAAEQATNLIGGIETAVVKEGISEAVLTLPPPSACLLIRGKAEKALQRLGECRPFKMPPPYRFEIELVHESTAEIASWIPGIKRETPRSISYTDSDLLKIIPLLRIITRFISL